MGIENYVAVLEMWYKYVMPVCTTYQFNKY
jgi:hypothetical protein